MVTSLLMGLTILLLAVPAAAKEKNANANPIPPAAIAWNPPADASDGKVAYSGRPPINDPGDSVSPTLPYGLSKDDELPFGLAKRDELPPGLAKRTH